MNDVLLLKGRFEHAPNPTKPGAPKLPSKGAVTAKHVALLIQELKIEQSRWLHDSTLSKALLDVHYNRIIGFLTDSDIIKRTQVFVLLIQNVRSFSWYHDSLFFKIKMEQF